MPNQNNQIKRVNYFDKQFLRAKEFQDEQNYHKELRKLHNKNMHSTGVVVNGLAVIEKIDRTLVGITRGMAIDSNGQEIILLDEYTIQLSTVNGEVDVYISYKEEYAEKTNDQGVEGRYTRVIESCEITFSQPQSVPQNGLCLARLKIVNGRVDSITDKRVIINSSISNGSIEEIMLKTDSVSTRTIQNNAVTGAELQSDAADNNKRAVDTNHIKDKAVTADKLRSDMTTDINRAVTSNHIRDGAVTEAKLGTGAVTQTKIGIGAVIEGKLGSGAVTETKIAIGAVTEGKLGTGAVTQTKIGIGAVIEGKLGSGAVTETKIGIGAVKEEKLATNAVTETKIATNTVKTEHIKGLAVTKEKIANGAVSINKMDTFRLYNSVITVNALSYNTCYLDQLPEHCFYIISTYSKTNNVLFTWEYYTTVGTSKTYRYIRLKNLSNTAGECALSVYRLKLT